MKILVAPDKFKGSITARNFCCVAVKEIKKMQPNAKVVMRALADGGEGTIECLLHNFGGELKALRVQNANFKKKTSYWAKCGELAVVECAAACGLSTTKNKDPRKTTSYGVGQLIERALLYRCKNLYLGVGGTATNDAGAGMAAALGVRFYDKNGKTFVPTGDTLDLVEKIDTSGISEKFKNIKITILSDVTNPLYGENGAAFVYAKQKGAAEGDILVLDEKLQKFAEIVKRCCGFDFANVAGAGAGGGIAYGAMVFLGGNIESGFDRISKLLELEAEFVGTDIVVTGEGCFDEQTENGKVCAKIFALAGKKQIPVLVFCGENTLSVEKTEALLSRRIYIVPVNDPGITLTKNLRRTKRHLRRAVRQCALLKRDDNI